MEKNDIKNAKAITQVRKMPDGTEKKIVVWGGYEVDGYDRTMNIYMDMNFHSIFLEYIFGDKADEDSLDDPCEFEEGYQMFVDFLDTPVMCIFRCGQGKISTEMYVRDERRTFGNTLEAGTGELYINNDGSLRLKNGKAVNKETIKDIMEKNKFAGYAVLMLGIRKYLIKEGIAQKLYDMFDESAGVVVSVSKSGKITTKIVKGKQRPDLVCNVFLLGEQKCRPYIDEMLGLKSKGVRKPKDPEKIAKLKEEKKLASKEKNKKKLAMDKSNLTLANRRLIKAKAKVEEAKLLLEPENDKRKDIEIEVSKYEEKYNQVKDEYQPQIDELEKKKKEIEDSHNEKVRAFNATEAKLNIEISTHSEDAKKNQATFEIVSEVADVLKEKATKGGFSKKKNPALYEEKQAEADRLKSKVKEKLQLITDLEADLQKERDDQKLYEKKYSSDKREIEHDIQSKSSFVKDAKDELDKVKQKLNEQEKIIESKKTDIKKAETEIESLEKEISRLTKSIKTLGEAVKETVK